MFKNSLIIVNHLSKNKRASLLYSDNRFIPNLQVAYAWTRTKNPGANTEIDG